MSRNHDTVTPSCPSVSRSNRGPACVVQGARDRAGSRSPIKARGITTRSGSSSSSVCATGSKVVCSVAELNPPAEKCARDLEVGRRWHRQSSTMRLGRTLSRTRAVRGNKPPPTMVTRRTSRQRAEKACETLVRGRPERALEPGRAQNKVFERFEVYRIQPPKDGRPPAVRCVSGGAVPRQRRPVLARSQVMLDVIAVIERRANCRGVRSGWSWPRACSK